MDMVDVDGDDDHLQFSSVHDDFISHTLIDQCSVWYSIVEFVCSVATIAYSIKHMSNMDIY